MTMTTRLVLNHLLSNNDPDMFGLQIVQETGLAVGTVYPILRRLETVGWVRSRWEDIDPVTAGRPVRCYYAMTDQGRVAAKAALSRVEAAEFARRRTENG
jgi:DNA-binding PadR family transcriptional regulator